MITCVWEQADGVWIWTGKNHIVSYYVAKGRIIYWWKKVSPASPPQSEAQ